MATRRKVWPVGTGDPWTGWPVSTPFGRKGPWAWGSHTGADYASPHGKPVRVVKRGTVVEVGTTSWGAAYGDRSVIIQDLRKRRWLYAHLDSNTVRVGEKVRKKQVIGKVGTRGNSTGPHLHLEVRVAPYRYGNDARNPLDNGAGG